MRFTFAALTLATLSACASGPYPHLGIQARAGAGIGQMSRSGVALVPASMPVEGPVEGVLAYGNPIPLPSQGVWLSPYVVQRKRSLFRDSDPFTKGGAEAKGLPAEASDGSRLATSRVRWHNALLVDRTAGDEWMLLDQRACISRWWMLLAPGDQPAKSSRGRAAADRAPGVARGLVFAVTLDDTNGDGVLDDRDASAALVTDGAGRLARIVTPRDTQLAAVDYEPLEDQLVFTLLLDSNGDGEFEGDEERRLEYLPLAGDAQRTTPWHAPDLVERLDGLYRQ